VFAAAGSFFGSGRVGSSAITQAVDVWNASTGTLPYAAFVFNEAGPAGQWLSIMPTSGTATTQKTRHNLLMNPGMEGSWTGTVTFMASGTPASNDPYVKTVAMHVSSYLAANPSPVSRTIAPGATARRRRCASGTSAAPMSCPTRSKSPATGSASTRPAA
jgi:hypothetical protein